MRVLAHIHTFNDADIIDRTIDAVLRQTRPVDGIVVVDNASTDGTLDRPSVKHAVTVRHEANLGTSGAVHSGFRFALEHDYDWIVIGSGFGGSVSALRLAEKGYRVGVLECGRRFEDDDFARSTWNWRRFLWLPRLGLRGILRISLFKDVTGNYQVHPTLRQVR